MEEQKSGLEKTKKTLKLTGAALALGAIIGAAVGLLTAPKKGSEMREDLEKQAEEIWKRLNRRKEDVEGLIKKTFGEVTPESLRLYTKAKSEILTKVAKERAELTQARYEEIVDSVMERLSKGRDIKEPIANLGKEFKKTWKEISDIIRTM